MDIIACIIGQSEFELIASWKATSRECHRAVRRHLRERYLVCVGAFIKDTDLFDRLLVRHGGIVSGSVALRFFLPRGLWAPNDLDIYVPESEFDGFVAAITDPDGLKLTLIDRDDSKKVSDGGTFAEQV